ncbi:UNVERIFIED_ORG: hypothetical protein J2791_001406 [Burkholderia contaminans]|nr:hypothetical protein [Burkholderia contaminans]
MGIGAYTVNGYRLKGRAAAGFGPRSQQTLEPLRMEMDRRRESVGALPYIRLQNPAAPVSNGPAAALKWRARQPVRTSVPARHSYDV